MSPVICIARSAQWCCQRAAATRGYAARTVAAQAMGLIDPTTRAVVPPIHTSTTFVRDADNGYSSTYVYGRPDNATVRHAEQVLAALEGAGEALLFGSGMAAATAVFQALKPGDHVVASRVMYWSLRKWLLHTATRWGLQVDFVPTDDLAALRAATRPGRTKLLWVETPGNPLLTITDLAAAAEIAHAAGARLAVDSTLATPLHCQPLQLGADIVMHAATKALNGHSDVLAGVLATRAEEGDGFWQEVKQLRGSQGGVLGGLEAFLLLRGLRTFPLRAAAQASTAAELARRLQQHPAVSQVLYPGLPSHAGHEVAARQMRHGFGGLLAIRLAVGDKAAIAVAARVELWKRATSLGGVESLIEHRASVEGPDSPCPPDLLRLSVGLEDVEDLWRDLEQALA